MLSHKQQLLILQISKQPFGIYMTDQKIYKHQRAFYRAIKPLEKYEILEKVYIPIINKTRLTLCLKGELVAFAIEPMMKGDNKNGIN